MRLDRASWRRRFCCLEMDPRRDALSLLLLLLESVLPSLGASVRSCGADDWVE